MISYYFNYQKNECLKNPLTYGAKQLQKSTGVEVIGQISFLNYPDNSFYFNSEKIIPFKK